jgi:signal transduction histidine kinase
VNRRGRQDDDAAPREAHRVTEMERELVAVRRTMNALFARLEITPSSEPHFEQLEQTIAARMDELAQKSHALEETNRQLQDLTAHLDESVRQRTRALAESEAQLRRRNAELARLNRLKSEFISIAAHEFRTPMTAIIGYLDLMVEGRMGTVPPRMKRPLASLHRNAYRMRRLLEELLDVSRLESGRMVLRLSRCDLNELVAAAVAEHEPFFTAKHQRVEFRAAAELPHVDCDADKIHQVVTNLLGNAIKYTKEGGEIVLSTFQPDAAHVALRVRDNGMGIPRWARERIFEPFSEIGESRNHTSDAPDPAGLGLYIAKGIVELHGAAIQVESEEGRFAEFTVRLPLVQAASAARSRAGQ